MGYAHGVLMADKIRDLVDHFMIGLVAGGNVATYNTFVSKMATTYQWQPQYLDEMNGLADGMAASGKNLYVPSLGRNIDVRDIKAFNLQEEFFFACSSFGVWGTATATGEAILARNFDFPVDAYGNFTNYQIIIAFEPTGKRKFVSFAWPGMIGVFSGINENGINVFENTGNGSNGSRGPYHSIIEVFRNVLENTTSNNFLTQPLSIIKSFKEYTPEILQVGMPYLGTGIPVYYVEESPTNKVNRYPADTDPSYDHIIATNHFIKALTPPSSGESVTRYNTIRNGLINLYRTGNGKVDSAEAWGILNTVADIVAPTVTSIVYRPNRMEFDLSFGKWVNGSFTSATKIPPQTHTFAGLFPDFQLPDLIVQSIAANPTSPALNQPVTVAVTVKNQGWGQAGPYSLDYYKNLVSPPALQQAGEANCLKNGLAPGATDSCSFVVTFSEAGSYKMYAQVDTQQQVPESDETNNVFGPQAITAVLPTLVSVTLNPTNVQGGTSSQGTVTLSSPAPTGGLQVSLSDNSSSAITPTSVTIDAGSTFATFTITTTSVSSSTPVTISAVYSGLTKTAVLTVTPLPLTVGLSSLTLNPTSVRGRSTSQGTVTLSGPAPSGGVTVALSDNSYYAGVPSSVTIAAGSTSATFTVTTASVTRTKTVTVSAVYGGLTKTAVLTITR
jgi:hypothetical protein